MGNSCKSRSPATSAQPVQVQRTKGKVNYSQKGVSDATVNRPTSKQTRSWSRLRDEAPLNPNAEEFVPQGVGNSRVPQQQGNTKPREDVVAAREDDDPEWMQYLSQRLHSQPAAAKASPQPGGRQSHPSQMRGVKAAESRAAAAAAALPRGLLAQPDGAGDNGGSGFVLRTDDYMKLLKDGGDCPRGRQKPLERGPTIPVHRMPNSAALFSASVAKGHSKDVSDIPASVGLGRLWSNAFSATEATNNASAAQSSDHEESPQKVSQDDTLVERTALDIDRSDELYWSDGGDGKFPAAHGSSALVPSAHRLRSRQPAEIRSYVMQDLSEELDAVTAMLLGRMQCFNLRMAKLLEGGAHSSPKRRFIIGLKEVFRRVKQGHVTALLVAPDIESSSDRGKLDDRMREVLAYSYQHELPVIFALSRKRIGRALGMSLNISIMGLMDVTGARDLCEQALGIARAQRLTWLEREETNRKKPTSQK